MSEAPQRRTTEGLRRLIAFCDAVVAIALTLLILPLADIVTDLREPTTLVAMFRDNSSAIVSFLISFAVIWVCWRHHHRIMEHFRAYDNTLISLHSVWLLTIVALPFATGTLEVTDRVRYGNVFYIGVLTVSISVLLAIERWGAAHRDLLEDESDEMFDQWMARRNGYGTIITLLIALVIAAIRPEVGNWPLILVVLSGPIESMLARAVPYVRRGSGQDGS
ncbi:TMEM175 family protein [Gordonia soli]|nr:TMEM175 family protein [Gordonia soli]